jgi:hypothetical protein
MHTFEKSVLETVGVAPYFYTAVEKTGAGVDMAKFNNYVAVIQMYAATQYAGTLTAVIAESTDNTTYSDTYLATVTIASSTTTNAIDTVEIKASDMSAGYRYLRAEITPGAGTQNYFSVTNLRFNPRFSAVQ